MVEEATAQEPQPARRDAGRSPADPSVDPAALAIYRLVSLAGALLGAWVCWKALGLTYYTPLGPGPGFFPFWLGSLLGVFSAAILVRSFLRAPAATSERFVPPGGPALQIAVTVAAIAAFALLVERLGFAITMFSMLLVLLTVRGCRLFPTAFLVALGGSFGVGFAFSQWLGVYVPPAPFGLLRVLGL